MGNGVTDTYYDTSYPPSLWEPAAPVVPATGATAGIPGTWTPAGSTPPATVADLIAGTPNAVVASPVTAWTIGQYVQTATIGTTGRAYWNGTAWVAGTAAFSVVGQTIDAVKAYVESLGDSTNPDVQAETQRLLDEERSNANRSTLVSWLDQRLGIELAPEEPT